MVTFIIFCYTYVYRLVPEFYNTLIVIEARGRERGETMARYIEYTEVYIHVRTQYMYMQCFCLCQSVFNIIYNKHA